MKISVIGLGYIGLPTSIMFAKHENQVVGVDISQEVINKLNSGVIHLEEPGLQEALDDVLKLKTFKASLNPERADVFIIAVPTPNMNDKYKSCDLSNVVKAIKSIIPLIEKGNTIIIESTIGPRSMDHEIKPLIESEGFEIGKDIFLVHCPERVLPGKILTELITNNRIIGGITNACANEGKRVYEEFVKGEIILTNAKTAEMSKLMENTFRDVNIALANELVQVCTELEVNALDVISMANKHPRVNLHQPGPGVGGHCLAVDPNFIVAKAPEKARIIKLARETNNSMPRFILDSINKLLKEENDEAGLKITLFGLTYKGNVDDIRESPAMEIKFLLETETNYELSCFDPHVVKPFVEKDVMLALTNSDLILILADHDEFKNLEKYPLELMKNKLVFDTKNIVGNIKEDVNYVNLGNLFGSIKKRNLTKV